MYKYVGDGAAIVGIPARDLSKDEVKELDKDLIEKSGLYEKIKEKGETSEERKVNK